MKHNYGIRDWIILVGIGKKKNLWMVQWVQFKFTWRQIWKRLKAIDFKKDSESKSPVLKTLFEIYEIYNLTNHEPSSYNEAAKHQEWVQAMKEEIAAIEKNQTWENSL